eukprot:9496009-Pyramimonas_sp.AAC.1
MSFQGASAPKVGNNGRESLYSDLPLYQALHPMLHDMCVQPMYLERLPGRHFCGTDARGCRLCLRAYDDHFHGCSSSGLS